jgi:hypothetical protein
MRVFKFIFTVIFLFQFLQSCVNNRQEEFINLKQTTIDSGHFVVMIYSKTKSDSIILYNDTIVGKLLGATKFETEWFNDSVRCLVPEYIPEKTYRTHTNLKVILKHKI